MSSARYRKEDEAVTSRMPPTKDERSFMTFLWNPQTKVVLGRTGASWAKIGLFYIVFYSFLAGFFSLLMVVFYQTLNYHAPKYTGSDSLLLNPGLDFRPRTHNADHLRPTITYYPSSFGAYADSINKYLDPYRTRPSNAIECSPSDGYRKENDPVCYFDINTINTTCSPENGWGYNTNSPCILLKLNKMFHWKPEPLLDFERLPDGLQRHINASENPEELLQQNVWVWCESEEVEMEQSSPGLPLSYYPYVNQEGYRAPFVLVRLLDLPVDQKVNVLCRVWAINVDHRVNQRRTGEVTIFVHVQ